MDLSSIPDISVGTEGTIRKFVVARVYTESIEKLVIRADGSCDYHVEVFDLLNKEVSALGFKAECLGGGFLNVRSRIKCIFVSGKSTRYGAEPDRQWVLGMLRKQFPEHLVEALD